MSHTLHTKTVVYMALPHNIKIAINKLATARNARHAPAMPKRNKTDIRRAMYMIPSLDAAQNGLKSIRTLEWELDKVNGCSSNYP